MAITRGQMQRQLRRGGGIMNVASGTIGGGNYTGIPMGSRTGFGILDKVKDRVRKIIPNEISKVATVAAPFVAPFNPALAGAMAGIGSFDQSGSISDALKRGALTYGGGQAARFIGGADFQRNPFNEPLISSPLGTDTGLKLGRFFEKPSNVSGITTVDEGALQKTVNEAALKNLSPEKQISEKAVETFIENQAKANVTPSITQLVKEGNYIDAAVEAGKKGLKAVFMDGDKLDKTALLAAGSFGLSYLDAKKIADDAGVDIGTETEYDEATKDEFKEKYSNYLTNFFGGKKDGGRIGFADGTDKSILQKIASVFFDEEGNARSALQRAKFELSEFIAGKGTDLDTGAEWYNKLKPEEQKEIIMEKIKYRDRGELGGVPLYDEEFAGKFGIGGNYAEGGRIGFRFGDKVKDEEGIMSMSKLINRPDDAKEKIEELEDIMSMSKDEDMDDLMAGTGINFSRQEKSYLFRRLGGAGGADRSYTMPNLYRILSNPSRYPEDARVLKQIAIMGLSGKKDGGRIGAKDGFSFMELIDDKAYNKKLKVKEDLINELMEKGYRFEDIMQLVSPRTKRLMDDGTYKEYGDAPSISLGKIGLAMGGEVPVRKNKAGIEELDYRQTGGFVPVGVKEKADDVPAMLSKNEFVLTADAVRGIGGGDVEKGAEKLYGVMKQAEKVGRA